MSLRYDTVHQHQSKDSHPQDPRRPALVLPEQQVSPQTNALENDRITREKKERKDVHWPVLHSLLHKCNLLVHRNRCRKEKKQVEREDTSYDWHDCGVLPINSSHLSIIQTSVWGLGSVEYRFK